MDFLNPFIKSIIASETAAKGILLAYKGEMNHKMVQSFAFMVNNKIESLNVGTAVRKRVFHVCIECLQNIIKHGPAELKKDTPTEGFFAVGQSEDAFFVVCGNTVNTEQMTNIESRIDILNRSTEADLKRMFLQQMVEGEINERGGAGLGLIDIKRKSGRPLYCHFVPCGADQWNFILATSLPIHLNEA